MEKKLCTTLYDMEQDTFTYKHPYHKIVFVKSGKIDDVRKLKLPRNFQFEDIQRESIDFGFRREEGKKDLKRTFKSSRSKNLEFYRTRRVVGGAFNKSFMVKSEFVQNMRVRGASASLIRRKTETKPLKRRKNPFVPNSIHIHIKKISIKRRKLEGSPVLVPAQPI